MLILTKKRGQLVLKPAMEILVAIAIILLFIYVGRVWGTGELFQKIRITKNTALSVDTLSSLPGNTQIVYTRGLSKYTINLDSNNVKLSSMVNDPLETTHPFIQTTEQSITANFKNPKRLVIAKSGNNIELSNESIPLNKNRCPLIKTKKLHDIILVPRIKQEQEYSFTKILTTYPSLKNAEIKDEHEIKEIPDAILEIIQTTKSDTLKAHITPNLESRKLACLILNNILEKNPDLNTVIIPSDKSILSEQRIGVSIELWPEIEESTYTPISKAFEKYQNV